MPDSFEEIIKKDYLYIDKTEYIYRMANGVSKYCFLSRPRRFGKSLLTSTLHSYFGVSGFSWLVIFLLSV